MDATFWHCQGAARYLRWRDTVMHISCVTESLFGLQVSVMSYGAFVDIGSLTDGLVHVSQIAVCNTAFIDVHSSTSYTWCHITHGIC